MLKKIIPVFVVIGALMIVVVLTSKRPSPEKAAPQAQAMLVTVEPVEAHSLRFAIESQGTVRPRTETTLVSELSGKIVSVASGFVAGGFFRRGDVLIEIDPSDYETAVMRAEAALAGRQAQLAQERARSEQALKDWQNLDRRDDQPSDLVLRKPQLAEAEAQVAAAQADLMKARRDLERTRIRAPYDGMVREKAADIGQYVTPATRLGVTFAVDRAEIRLPLAERDLAFVELPWLQANHGAPKPAIVRATVAGREALRQVEIVRTEGVLDEKSRVVYAVAEVIDPYNVLSVGNSGDVLPIGTFVTAEIEGIRADNVVALPRYNLRTDGTVLVASPDNTLEVREVEIVRQERDLVYVSAGLQSGDRVVTSSIQVPVPGAELTIAGEEAPVERIADGTVPGDQGVETESTPTLSAQAGDQP